MITKLLFILLLINLLEPLIKSERNPYYFESTNPDVILVTPPMDPWVTPPLLDEEGRPRTPSPGDKPTVSGPTIDQLLPPYIKKFEEMLKNDNYKGFLESQTALVAQLRPRYQATFKECDTNWNKNDYCPMQIFQPILSVIQLLEEGTLRGDIDKWSLPEEEGSGQKWKTVNIGKQLFQSMINLLKKVLSKERVDSNLFKREILYARLNHMNSNVFPWKESPLAQYAQKWYDYALLGNDEEIRKVLDLNMAVRTEDVYCGVLNNEGPLCSFKAIQAYCNNQKERIPLCSFLSIKMTYLETLRSLPQNASSVVSIWAYYGDQDGSYASRNKALGEFVKEAKLAGHFGKLSGKLATYFGTLARFDNGIAKADVGYLTSAIDKNNERLGTNARTFIAAIKSIDTKGQECKVLNLVEELVMIAVNVAGVAAGGAGALSTISGLGPKIIGSTKTILKISTRVDLVSKSAVIFAGNVKNLVAQGANANEIDKLKTQMSGLGGTLTKIIAKFDANKEKIDGMNAVMELAIGQSDMASVQDKVNDFLASYTDYTPGVTKPDLAELNKQYEDMLDSFARTFETAGMLCSIFVSDGAAKVRQAKAVWTLINALLEDIYTQQFDMINALVKVVRSKLDMTAAENFAPEINFNFEITTRHMLNVRVAALEVCNALQLIYNDDHDRVCQTIKDKVFLSEEDRRLLEEKEKNLQSTLAGYKTKNHIAYIPVSNVTTTHTISWNDLVSGNITEFALPIKDESFLLNNGWIHFPSDLVQEPQLLRSLQVFIPNVLSNKDRTDIKFAINASQENVVVNGKPNAQRYAIRAEYPLSTISKYNINENPCLKPNTNLDLYVSGSKYCIQDSSGNLGDLVRRPLPASMFSKFQIRLLSVLPGKSLELLRAAPPFGDTLKLRVSIEVFTNPGAVRPASGTTSNDDSHTQSTEPCGPGQYRRIIDAKRQECTTCPPGSIPFAQGIYCISQETARKMGITTAGSFEAKQFASASDKETIDTEPIKAKTKPSLFQRFKNWIG